MQQLHAAAQSLFAFAVSDCLDRYIGGEVAAAQYENVQYFSTFSVVFFFGTLCTWPLSHDMCYECYGANSAVFMFGLFALRSTVVKRVLIIYANVGHGSCSLHNVWRIISQLFS